jgi:hypothetical protein
MLIEGPKKSNKIEFKMICLKIKLIKILSIEHKVSKDLDHPFKCKDLN